MPPPGEVNSLLQLNSQARGGIIMIEGLTANAYERILGV